MAFDYQSASQYYTDEEIQEYLQKTGRSLEKVKLQMPTPAPTPTPGPTIPPQPEWQRLGVSPATYYGAKLQASDILPFLSSMIAAPVPIPGLRGALGGATYGLTKQALQTGGREALRITPEERGRIGGAMAVGAGTDIGLSLLGKVAGWAGGKLSPAQQRLSQLWKAWRTPQPQLEAQRWGELEKIPLIKRIMPKERLEPLIKNVGKQFPEPQAKKMVKNWLKFLKKKYTEETVGTATKKGLEAGDALTEIVRIDTTNYGTRPLKGQVDTQVANILRNLFRGITEETRIPDITKLMQTQVAQIRPAEKAAVSAARWTVPRYFVWRALRQLFE